MGFVALLSTWMLAYLILDIAWNSPCGHLQIGIDKYNDNGRSISCQHFSEPIDAISHIRHPPMLELRRRPTRLRYTVEN